MGVEMTARDLPKGGAAGRRTRRQFIRGLLRGAALGGLAALGMGLGASRRGAKGSQTCVNRGICRACTVYDACALPQAQAARYAAEKRDET